MALEKSATSASYKHQLQFAIYNWKQWKSAAATPKMANSGNR